MLRDLLPDRGSFRKSFRHPEFTFFLAYEQRLRPYLPHQTGREAGAVLD